MLISADDPLVTATARLLSVEPGLSNVELIQRLARILGEDVLRRVPINRFQRQVRDPAMKAVRSRSGNGGFRSVGSESAAAVPKNDRRGTGARARMPDATVRSSAPEALSARVVDEALVEAFVMGASWDDTADGIAAFRKLDELRRRVGKALGSDL